jgi:uncharacterized protein with PIN domain
VGEGPSGGGDWACCVGHGAILNPQGDCFSYGLARVWNTPLLFKSIDATGSDFAATDVALALPS